MTFCEALYQAFLGKTIVSNTGNRYRKKHFGSFSGGKTWFNIPSTTSMTKSEREGKWEIA